MSILLIVGNGVTIDYSNKVVPPTARLNTNRPLSWQFPALCAERKPASEVFVELKVAVDYICHCWPKLKRKDFDIIEKITSISPYTPEFRPLVKKMQSINGRWSSWFADDKPEDPLKILGDTLTYILRLYLQAAFNWLELTYQEYDSRSWEWRGFFVKINDRINAIISFNYDLIIEHALQQVSSRPPIYAIRNYRDLHNVIPIIKPHGSINFKVSQRVIYTDKNPCDGNAMYEIDGPIEVHSDPTSTHVLAAIVLPKEYSHIEKHQYIECGTRIIKSRTNYVTECIIAGLSYWEHDRPELDRVFDQLRPETKISVVNPEPPPALIAALKQRFTKEPIIVKSPLELLR